jgi:putative acetyltransferase
MAKSRVEIRPEAAGDRAAIHAVEAAAFGERSEADLVDALREAAHPYLSLVAAIGAEIVGHVFFSPVEIEFPADAPAAAGLGPIGVDPAHQGRGIGSALVRAGLERCRLHGWRVVFLVGNPAYYSRFGFELGRPRGFSYGNPVLDPALQVVELAPGVLEGCRGRVAFHPAFAEAEGS